MNNLSGKKVAVTGGAGLIGSFLSEKLVQRGANVIVIDDFSKGRKENLASIEDHVEVREGDLEIPEFALESIKDCEYVFHLASRAYGVGYSQGHHLKMLQHNEKITNNILEAMAGSSIKHALITSSSCVYDDNGPDKVPELSLFEGNPENVNRGYGWAKRFLEQKSVLYSEEAGIPMTIVRPFNIYGERYRWVGQYSQAIPMLVKRIMDREDPVTIWGSGKQRRNYIHAYDCAELMTSLVERGHVDGPVNLGLEETVSMVELVTLICEQAGVNPKIAFDTSKPEGRFIKSSDSGKLFSLLPEFSLEIDLPEGINRMLSWYQDTF